MQILLYLPIWDLGHSQTQKSIGLLTSLNYKILCTQGSSIMMVLKLSVQLFSQKNVVFCDMP